MPIFGRRSEEFRCWSRKMRHFGIGSRPGSRPWAVRRKRPKLRNAQTFVTTLDDGSLVLGNIELKDRSLMLSANSKTRAEKGRALLSEHLGELVGQPLVEMQTVEQLLASRDTRPSPPPADLSPKDQRGHCPRNIGQALSRHARRAHSDARQRVTAHRGQDLRKAAARLSPGSRRSKTIRPNSQTARTRWQPTT